MWGSLASTRWFRHLAFGTHKTIELECIHRPLFQGTPVPCNGDKASLVGADFLQDSPPPGHVAQGGGGKCYSHFFAFSAFFSHFLGRSLSVMFKRIHSSGIV